MAHDYSITFACFNAVQHTKNCIQSLMESNTPLEKIAVIDNASSDGTREYLESLALGARIYNRDNLACGAAWNQGILNFQTEWTIVMNNDILVTPFWIDGLIDCAKEHGLKIISPARIDGDTDYDIPGTLREFKNKMHHVLRSPYEDAVCMCIHKSVFFEIGYFRANPKMLGFEDAIFFHDARKKHIPTGLTGNSWIHHLGSVTQNEMKKTLGIRKEDVLIQHKDREILHQSWLERKLSKRQIKKNQQTSRATEIGQYGMTLLADRFDGQFHWK